MNISNQRPGKWKPAVMIDDSNSSIKLLEFFKSSAEVLERAGKDDAAFYFSQVEDWLRSGKQLTGKSATHILGL
jgi:hypothetical protein